MRMIFLAALLAGASPALGDDVWQQIDTNPGAYWVASAGGRQLELRCGGESGLDMLLLGGQIPLPAEVETEGEIVAAVSLWPSGYTDATPLSWLGPFDNAVSGPFPTHPDFLEEFTRSERLTITGSSGEPMFDAPMTGADWARFGFGEVCGL